MDALSFIVVQYSLPYFTWAFKYTQDLQSWTKLLGHFRMYVSKFLKIFTIKSYLAKLCQFDKATFHLPPSPKSML